MRRRASAMLIAMLVVAIIGAVGFGVVRITIKQLRQQGNIAASARAYQAAEAGLEYALLQYRLDKSVRLGSGGNTVDDWGIAWPTNYLARELNDDQNFSVRTTASYQRLGSVDCLRTAYASAAAWRACDGQDGRTMLRLKPGESVRVTPATAASKYLFVRALPENGGSTSNAYLTVTGYTAAGVTGEQKAWLLSAPASPVKPQSGYSTVSTDLAAAEWFTIKYVNDSSNDALLAAVGVSPWANDANRDALTFTTDRYLIEVVGRAGDNSVERQLTAVVNARTNVIDSLYDHSTTAWGTVDDVLSGGAIVTP